MKKIFTFLSFVLLVLFVFSSTGCFSAKLPSGHGFAVERTEDGLSGTYTDPATTIEFEIPARTAAVPAAPSAPPPRTSASSVVKPIPAPPPPDPPPSSLKPQASSL